MGILQHWMSFPTSPAPQQDSLRLVLYFLTLVSKHFTLALPHCKEEEYPVGAECCPKCSPGYRVEETCDEEKGTVCVPCLPGTYTAHLNGLGECLHCRVCDSDLETRQKCSSRENAKCGCPQGHFCVSKDVDSCTMCQSHRVCRLDQRVLREGSEWEDTVCEDCPPGTHSSQNHTDECQPWTNDRPGINTTDTTYSRTLWFCAIPASIIVVVVVISWFLIRRKRLPEGSSKEKSSHQSCPETDAETNKVLQADSDPTVPVEETELCGRVS